MESVNLTGHGFITISTGMDFHSEKGWKSVIPLLLSIFLVQFVGWTLREA